MLIAIRDLITDNILKGNNITIDSEEVYKEKLEYALSCGRMMASLSVLKDYTYDLLIVDADTENIVKVKTESHDNMESLLNTILNDLSAFIRMGKNSV